ncbi:ABC transporter permease [Sinorhizobium meliloti]|uniref:ABC transporter permease n=1 Tax=Rhizobium meliloti TaxID=382 RepID=UPI0013E3F090|nr:ABC transporter permease [Sinorhizobium meliloti]
MNPFLQHLRVTAALMVRETSTRYGSKPGGYIWAFVEPVAHILMMTLVFGAIARTPLLGKSFALFFATGYLPYMFYQSMQAFIAGAVKANKSLFNYPVVSPFDAVVSRYFVQAATSFVVAFLVFEILIFIENLGLTIDYAGLIWACALATFLGLGIGTANAALFAISPMYEQVFGLVMRPLYLISGVFFLPDSMPHPYSDFLLYNPVAHIIMAFRRSVYPEYRASSLDEMYVCQFIAVCMVMGVAFFTFSARSIRENKI